MSSCPYDVVVVGLGISGLSFLSALTEIDSDIRVLALDSGELWRPWEPRGSLGYDHNYQMPTGERIAMSTAGDLAPQDVPQWWTSRMAGGGFNRWYGQLSRFRAIDMDGSFGEPWVLRLEDFQPWYEVV